MIDVVRKTCNAGEKISFVFKSPCNSFFVKNFTAGAVLVCLGVWDDSQSIMVGAGTAETVMSNVDNDKMITRAEVSTVIVQAEQTGIVEVIRDD